MIPDLYHGTNQHFTRFKHDIDTRATHGASADVGFFLTTSRELAGHYAHNAMKRLVAGDHAGHERKVADLVRRAELASRRRDHDLYEQLTTEAEDLEVAARDQTHGMRIYAVEVDARNPKTYPDVGQLDLHEMRRMLIDDFTAGHDAVIFENIWDPVSIEMAYPDACNHVVVQDSDLIRIVSFEDLEPLQNESVSSPTW
ncbi:hypothetical protein ACEUZ9_002764 [Paracoccus litorisediminis]|uniref:hypothetical protein n=1 Tax=Paracoccus litorisediminis TaxID=2006130 RepID=UPI00372F8BC6